MEVVIDAILAENLAEKVTVGEVGLKGVDHLACERVSKANKESAILDQRSSRESKSV